MPLQGAKTLLCGTPGCRFACPGLCAPLGFQPALAKSETSVSLYNHVQRTMADTVLNDEKFYYTIREVAQTIGVSETLLRYWEKEFPQQIAPKKVARGVRKYTKDDIEKIRTVYDLVKVRGLKLAAARDVLKQNRQGVAQPLEAIQRLRKVREELMDMKRALEAM